MAEKSQPGWTPGVLSRSIVTGENPSNDIFIDGDAERPGNLLSDSRAAPGGIALLGGDNRINERFGRALGTGLGLPLEGKSRRYLRLVRIW